MNKSLISRVTPFALYMVFIALQDPIKLFLGSESEAAQYLVPMLYLAKVFFVSATLIFFWKSYEELKSPYFAKGYVGLSILVGIVVFVLWINMDWSFATMGAEGQEIFSPYSLPPWLVAAFIGFRIFGASIVVPVFEELFWRSFILRYIINPDFMKVKIGAFTWPSFVISSILFGLEHNLWLAGIMAGVFYNLLLYRTGNIWYCIFAHGITNFILGAFVVQTGSWQFW